MLINIYLHRWNGNENKSYSKIQNTKNEKTGCIRHISCHSLLNGTYLWDQVVSIFTIFTHTKRRRRSRPLFGITWVHLILCGSSSTRAFTLMILSNTGELVGFFSVKFLKQKENERINCCLIKTCASVVSRHLYSKCFG